MTIGDLPSVRVQFYGICTHFAGESIPDPKPADLYHRIVLVNASDPKVYRQASPHLAAVEPHVARLQIDVNDLTGPIQAAPWFPVSYFNGTIVEWKLLGVTLQIDQEQPVAEPRGIAPCIPHLTQHIQPLPDPPGPRTHELNRAETACFFDFRRVVIEPGLIGQGAVVGWAKVRSPAPALVVTSFEGETLTIPLQSGAEITISNIPEEAHTDKDLDFILHYLTLSEFPKDPWSPTEPYTCAPPLHPRNPPRNLDPLLTTPGCSDSNYP